jgi:mannose-6-phosphate isomerase-like protein (cupin superfamily)
MPTLERKENGWALGDQLIKSAYNFSEIRTKGIHEYPDNPEYADYFLTTDDWRLRVKLCRIRFAADNDNRWHLQTLTHSDCSYYIFSGQGEALLDKDRWVPISAGDLIYWNAGQPSGIRVTDPAEEVWYLAVEGPGPVAIADVDGNLHSVVGNGPPPERTH